MVELISSRTKIKLTCVIISFTQRMYLYEQIMPKPNIAPIIQVKRSYYMSKLYVFFLSNIHGMRLSGKLCLNIIV